MTSRFPFRSASTVGPLTLILTLALAGCSDSFNSGPLKYVENDRLASELKEKPELQKAVRKAMADLFGSDPKHIKVPEGSGLPGGGIYLASHQEVSKGRVKRIRYARDDNPAEPVPATCRKKNGLPVFGSVATRFSPNVCWRSRMML